MATNGTFYLPTTPTMTEELITHIVLYDWLLFHKQTKARYANT